MRQRSEGFVEDQLKPCIGLGDLHGVHLAVQLGRMEEMRGVVG